MPRRESRAPLVAPLTLSALFHAAIATLLFNTLKERKPVALPPMYRVEIVAAPPGERAIGEVASAATKPTTSVTPPTAAQSTVKEMPLPRAKPAPKTPARATPTEGKVAQSPKVSAPTEAKVTPQPKTEAFKPRNPAARLKAEVRFLIHRDGSVSDLTFIRRSGNFSFDLEAQGAVEAASSTGRFGPLPAGFPDDVLPVVFSFDPQFLK